MKMIDLTRATLITGDFNVCVIQKPSNIITTSLKRLGFRQLTEEATHILGILDFFSCYIFSFLLSYFYKVVILIMPTGETQHT